MRIGWYWAASLIFSQIFMVGCELEFQTQKTLPDGLARRIAQKRDELRQRPQDAEPVIQLAELYIEGERWFEAAETLDLARQRGASEDPRVLGGFAVVYLSLGYYRQVDRNLQACFQRSPREKLCLYAAGEFMMLIGSEPALQAARTVWRSFVKLAPNHPKAPYVRSALDRLDQQLGPPGRAASQPGGAASQPADAAGQPAGSGSSSPQAQAVDSPSETDHGQGASPPTIPGHAGATADQDVGELNPFGQAIQRALTADRNNDPSTAETAYREALSIRPNDVSALSGLAEAQLAQRKVDEAVTTIEKAWSIDPADPQARWVFGRVMLSAQRRTDEAIKAWEALARDNPEYARQLDLQQRIEAAKTYLNSGPTGE